MKRGREMMDGGFVKGGRKKREGFWKNEIFVTITQECDSYIFFIFKTYI